MTPKELKSSILQLAIQGKLVEQRPEEGTAEELYKQIQEEKQRLIAEKKIKKEKPLPEITEDEKPFDIPDNWKWVRVQEVTILNPKNNLDDEINVSFIPMKLIDDGFNNNYKFELKKWGKIKKGFTHFADGDIGIAKITPCFQNRKSVIFSELYNSYGAGTTELSIVRVINNLISRRFLLWFFKSAYFIENGVKSFTGTAGQQRIHKDYLSTCIFPLPPLAEQKRIVEKLEQIFPHIEQYEKAWNNLEKLNKRFPDDMKKSLLQYAIQGKLVEQQPEEGIAEELYKQIQEEKQRLIAEKKIKKEKPLPEITEDEKPFDIPDNWKWVRLGEVLIIERGSSPRPIKQYLTDDENGINWIKIGDTQKDNKYINNTKEKIIPEGMRKSRYVCKGDFLLSNSMSFGRPYILNINGCIHDGWLVLKKIGNFLDKNYLYYLISSKMVYTQFCSRASGAVVNNLNSDKVLLTTVAIPPLAEQKRIVEKLEQLLPLCERLK